jgi:hypothetical protein
MALQPLVSLDLLIIEALRLHSNTSHSLGLLCARRRELYMTHTRDRLPGPQRDSNPQRQHAVTAQPLQPANSHTVHVKLIRT